jgi:hypothetical protein
MAELRPKDSDMSMERINIWHVSLGWSDIIFYTRSFWALCQIYLSCQ